MIMRVVSSVEYSNNMKLKRYYVECPAVLSCVALTDSKESALEIAKEEINDLLHFLSKSAEGAQITALNMEAETKIVEISNEV